MKPFGTRKDEIMDAAKLRALQTPLKERYQKAPETALIPAGAEAVIDREDISCRVSTYAGTTISGLHPAAGGDGSKACSADMLMEALVACAGVTLKAVATAMRIDLKKAKVIASGTWDVRGTLAVDREAPVGLTDITLRFDIDSTADPKKIKKMIALTERYCVIYQTLAHPPKLTSELNLV
jgi:uncharacterized OsmC-like protein